ncbi:MAG: hypothetical protein HY052_07170 [Proteobacteria bacterium]|nr:hypothetical protein [Pseudomonadota bacterium]
MKNMLRRWGWRRVISAVATALVFLFFFYVLEQQWQAGKFHELKYPIAPILFSALGMFSLAVLLGFFWCWILGLVSGQRVRLRALFYVHFVSWLARYIPGKIGPIVGKIVLGENISYRRSALITSVLYENVFFIGSGVSTALLCLGPASLRRILSPTLSERWIMILALALIAGLLLTSYLLPVFMRRFLRSRGGVDQAIPAKSVVMLFISYHFAHLAAGAGFYFLLRLLIPQTGVPLVDAIGMLTAAHIVGALAFIVPAGLGVRESILSLLLVSYMPMDQAVLISLITRLWSTVADGYVLAAIPIIRFNLKDVGS